MNNVLNYKFPAKPLSTNEFPDYADQSFSLYSILAGVSRELYIIDVHNFNFISASVSALENLGISLQELRDLRVRDVFSDISHEFLAEELAKHSNKLSAVTELISQQGINSSFDTTLKLVYVKEQHKEVLIAIRGSDHEALAGTQQIHNIVSNIPSLVFEISLSPSNQITFNFLSEGCDALLGISRGTLLMRPDKFIELMRPQDRQSFMLSMKRSAKNLSIWNWEGGLWIEQWQDVKLINLRASANRDALGNVRWHGVITNITHSKNEKHELNKIISRFKTIVSNIPSLVFECTQNDKQKISFNYLNEGCHALLDIAPEELTANPQQLLDMILPADRESFLTSMQESAASLDVWNWEGGLWIEKWQDVKSVNLRATASKNLHGKVQWAGVITNITQSKNEKMALDEITNRFKAIVSNIPSLVFQCFYNHHNEISFNYLSDGCQALLGIDPDTLFMQPNKLLEIILPEDRESFINSMKKSAHDLSIWNWEGGLWIEEWQDIKLINLRASAMMNAQGQVQWGGVITNITQSKKERQEIERSHQQLAELSSHMSLVKEQERLRIAREIHDDLGGNLTTIKIGLASLIKSMEKHQPELIEKARQLEKLVDNTFDDAHRITADLRPNVLELGIVAALEWQAKEFENRIGIPFTFTTNDENMDLDVDRAIVLFRICQEATSNIAKYAKADSVEVDLMHQANEIIMQVSDDGVGIRCEDKLKRNAFGLRGMIERVQAVGGQISIEPGPICGTRVLVRLPL